MAVGAKHTGTFIKFTLAVALFATQLVQAQNNHKITGPLGVYHMAAGYTYSNTTGLDSILVQYQFRFGELNMPNQSFDNGFYFQPELDSCAQWNPNRVFAIIQPPSESGTYNQQADTLLYAPFAHADRPGMIQGGARFSKLSQLYGGFCGVILDDWDGNTDITGQVRDAVRGKYVNEEGQVYSQCAATTPYNKLYAVVYNTGPNPDALPVIDGVSYWYYQGQNCCYTSLDNDITQLNINYPHKEVLIGIYLKNTALGFTDPASVQYMLQHAINRYDDGDINGITLFAGLYLMKQNITINQWNAYGLPQLLDSLYYPYLGEGQGKVYDCSTGNALAGVRMHVFCRSKSTGDTLPRSYQQTSADGFYQCGLWAGNRQTDSTYYWVVAEKDGYQTDTMGFWVKRNDTTAIANISLCALPHTADESENNLRIYPNPANSRFTVVTQAPAGDVLEIYSTFGGKVYSEVIEHSYLHINMSDDPAGVYIVAIRAGERKFVERKKLVLQH